MSITLRAEEKYYVSGFLISKTLIKGNLSLNILLLVQFKIKRNDFNTTVYGEGVKRKKPVNYM